MKPPRHALLALALWMILPAVSAPAESIRVYFGTYTRGTPSEGIYLASLDTDRGVLSEAVLAGKADNPSFLAIAPNGRRLYSVEETNDFEGQKSGSVRAFAIHPDSGLLESLNRVATAGGAPCHLVTDSAGRHVLFANYSGGSAGAYAVKDDGALGTRTAFSQHQGSSVNPRRQESPHAHSINLDPAGRYAYVADLGLDQVLLYRYDRDSGALTPGDPPFVKVKPGAGPRHFDFRPDGRFAYVINELDSTVTAFACNSGTGALNEIQTLSTLPEGHTGGNSTAHVEAHPSGKFLYGSNRGHDSIAVFAIDASSGRLSLVEIEPAGGRTPRNFGIDPTGRYLLAAAQNSGVVTVFRIDESTGALEPTGSSAKVPAPVCVQFLARILDR